MTDNEAYRATLQRLRSDLTLAEARIEKLKAGIVAIEELIKEPSAISTENGTTRPVTKATEDIKTLTMRDAAAAALHLAGKPLRVRQIYDLLMKFEYPYTKGFEIFKGSMTPTLDRRTDLFQKVAPGLYALTRWPDAQKAPREDVAQGLLGGMVRTNGGTP